MPLIVQRPLGPSISSSVGSSPGVSGEELSSRQRVRRCCPEAGSPGLLGVRSPRLGSSGWEPLMGVCSFQVWDALVPVDHLK